MSNDNSENYLTFVAEYADGTKDYYQVACSVLALGEEQALRTAFQWQNEGKLRPGKIKRVYRF